MGSRNLLHNMVDEHYFLDKLMHEAHGEHKISWSRLRPNNQNKSSKSIKNNLDDKFLQ